MDSSETKRGLLMESWVCDFCGQTGRTVEGETTDQVLCPACGEPVTPAGD
jgi:rubrerythrin